MKKVIVFSITVYTLFISQAVSQPIIDKLYDFQPGKIYSYVKIPTGTILDTNILPSYGANLVWNLDSLPWESSIQGDSILSYAQSAKPTSIPGCTFVYKEYTGFQQFYRKSNDTLFYMGNASSSSPFSPNAITVIYPTVYQQNGYSFSNYQTNVPWNDVWTYSGRYNAYGTVKLVGGTYSDVALYIIKGGKTGQQYIDYMWVRQGEVDPLVRIQFKKTNSNFTVQFAYGLASAVLGDKEEHAEYTASIYPNPSQGQIAIGIEPNAQNIIIKQIDFSGRVLAERNYAYGGELFFKLNGKPGIYFIEITTDGNRPQTIKVVKE